MSSTPTPQKASSVGADLDKYRRIDATFRHAGISWTTTYRRDGTMWRLGLGFEWKRFSEPALIDMLKTMDAEVILFP
jgi:hypothetical protein